MAVLAFQFMIFVTLCIARGVSRKALDGLCILWTLFTLLAVFATPLILLQLITIWGTNHLLGGSVKESGQG